MTPAVSAPQSIQSVPLTSPATPTVELIESGGGLRLERLGIVEVAGVLSFLLMAVSAFLPWGEAVGILNVSYTGIQYGTGIELLVLSVIGAGAVLFPKKWTGYLCVLLGLVALFESNSAMSQLRSRVASITATQYFSVRVGSGIGLSIISSLFIMVDGVALVLKMRRLESKKRTAKIAEITSTSLTPVVTDKTVIPRSARVSEFDVWKPILWLGAITAPALLGLLANNWSPLVLAFLIYILATIWAYYDSKSKRVKDDDWIIVAFIAIIGLPWYAYTLHKLRKDQKAELKIAEHTVRRKDSLRIVKIVAVMFAVSWGVSLLFLLAGIMNRNSFLVWAGSAGVVLISIILAPLILGLAAYWAYKRLFKKDD